MVFSTHHALNVVVVLSYRYLFTAGWWSLTEAHAMPCASERQLLCGHNNNNHGGWSGMAAFRPAINTDPNNIRNQSTIVVYRKHIFGSTVEYHHQEQQQQCHHQLWIKTCARKHLPEKYVHRVFVWTNLGTMYCILKRKSLLYYIQCSSFN